jgi:hypothetical protein
MKRLPTTGNVGPQRKTQICYNALIQYKTTCFDCERLKSSTRRCLCCDASFQPTCMRRFTCYGCHEHNRTHDDVGAAVMGARE